MKHEKWLFLCSIGTLQQITCKETGFRITYILYIAMLVYLHKLAHSQTDDQTNRSYKAFSTLLESVEKNYNDFQFKIAG